MISPGWEQREAQPPPRDQASPPPDERATVTWRPARILEDVACGVARDRGGIILCFHEVDAARFTRWMEVLERYYRIVGLDELLDRRERGEPMSRLLALTFDDGWASTCRPVARICTQREWPMTIYAISSMVTDGGSLWFAELPAVVEQAAGRRISFEGRTLDFGDRRAAAAASRALARSLSHRPAADALAAVDAIRAALGLPAAQREAAPFIGERFVREYANSAWVGFGAHTVDHQSLASQDEAAQRRQLVESRAVLEALVGRPVANFCYPYGSHEAIGAVAPRLVRSLFRSGTTMLRGICTRRSAAWFLPRIALYDSDGDRRMLAKIALAGVL